MSKEIEAIQQAVNWLDDLNSDLVGLLLETVETLTRLCGDYPDDPLAGELTGLLVRLSERSEQLVARYTD